MHDGPVRGRGGLLQPLIGIAYVVALTAVVVAIAYAITVVVSWLA